MNRREFNGRLAAGGSPYRPGLIGHFVVFSGGIAAVALIFSRYSCLTANPT
jgi:hypothetical protein